MASVISNSRSEFVQNVIKTYSENRVGQYSKYLDTDPIYVTYYSINMVHSRADIGTDAIQDVTGSNSPIRYNKIEGLPVYIKGGFEPETSFEDGMITNDIDINDITILPNTVVPRPYDHILVKLPNMIPILLRVNGYRNLTIQSNDFFSASAHVVNYGDDITSGIDKLVVESYKCIFENIGTQNSCFLKSDEYATAVNLNEIIEEMSTLYHALYFDKDTNSYIYNESFYSVPNLVDPSIDFRQRDFRYNAYPVYPFHHGGMYPALLNNPETRKKFKCFMRPNVNIMTETVYDMYLTRFIMDSGLFYDGNNFDSTSAVVYEDLIPYLFDLNYKQSIWHAVITKNTTLLSETQNYILMPIRKQYSALVLGRFPSPRAVTIMNNGTNQCCDNNEYFSHELIGDLKNGRTATDNKCNCDPDADRAFINITSVINNPNKDFNSSSVSLKEYSVDMSKMTEEPEEELSEEDKNIQFLNDIIYNYIYDIDDNIDTTFLFSCLVSPSIYMYEYFPIILYILKKKYDGMFEQLS